MRRGPVLSALLLSLWSCASCWPAGRSQLIGYASSLDRSVQEYGLYLPNAPAPPAGYPAIFHMHGYGWWVGTGFSDWQQRWADDHGWILVNLNARGPQFYEGVGDVETRNVVRDANQRFGLDLSRLFLTGGSMGGTGAFRLGIRYPDLFAGAVGVDGWSDYKEWHHHWYARADQRDDIEEFRRPLLEAASPLYWAGRARWTAVQASVSGRDDVVLPANGLLLYGALLGREQETPGAYANRLFLDYDAGHGGATRMDQIYAYFLNRQTHGAPPSFLCETPVLTHGEMYWGSMLRQKTQGAASLLESVVDATAPPPSPLPSPSEGPAISRPAVSGESRKATGEPNGGPDDIRPLRTASAATVTVITRNLTAAALHLHASPAADARDISLYVDGFLAYQGPPKTVRVAADLSPRGDLWGWSEEPADAAPPLAKTPALEGPLGEAFKRPFIVVYGTAGTAAQTSRNRREAEDFVRGWNGFMVHADALKALPEERLSPSDLAHHSLVIYGTEQSSALLSRANATHELPVRVREEGVTVSDPQWGERAYLGSQFGAFLCTPNPLADCRQYLVVCRGQWATKPDGSGRQGLEYDLEKLPWAYSDYVVFNTDQAQLPHVLNVNNKPPVTCYEAGYFVEAGWFDQDWQPYRMATLDRIRAKGLPTKLIHVESLQATPDGLRVLIADAAGAPVPQARVTVRSYDGQPVTISGVAKADGFVMFAALRGTTPCGVVNVMATGAEYDWQADRVQSTDQRGIALVARTTDPDENGLVRVTAELGAERAERLSVRVIVPVGQLDEPSREVELLPGEKANVTFVWRLPRVPAGPVRALVQVTAQGGAAFARPVFATAGHWSESPLRVTEFTPADIMSGAPWQVTAKLTNLGSREENVTACAALPADRQYAPPQPVALKPGEEATVVIKQSPGTPWLDQGFHGVRFHVPGHRGVTATGEFTVR